MKYPCLPVGYTRGQSTTPKHPLEGKWPFPLEGVQNIWTRSSGKYDTPHGRTECLAAHTLEAEVIFHNPPEGNKPLPLEGVQNFGTRSSGKHETHRTDVQSVRPRTLWRPTADPKTLWRVRNRIVWRVPKKRRPYSAVKSTATIPTSSGFGRRTATVY